MGLNAAEGAYESGGSSGMSGGSYGGGAGEKEKKEKKGFLAGLWDAVKQGLLSSTGLPGTIANEAINKFENLEKAQNFLEKTFGMDPDSPEAEAAHEKANASAAATAAEKDVSGKGADPGANTGGRVKEVVPVPKVVPKITPLAATTPTFSTDLFPAQMGTATVKKKKLLGGDIMRRV